MSLTEFQHSMRNALRDSTARCPGTVVQQESTGQSRRFNIYRNNRVVSLIDNLQAVYPTVHKLVGDVFFRAAAKLYIKEMPPRSAVMSEYGVDFGGFIGRLPTTSHIPWIKDMADLEWARMRAYHAPDASTLTTDLLTTVTPQALETLCLSVHPSLTILSSRWPIGSIWHATSEENNDHKVNMKYAEEVLTVRPLLNVETHILPADGAMFLRQLKLGLSLTDAVAHVTEHYSDFNPGNHLHGLLSLGAFTSTYHHGARH